MYVHKLLLQTVYYNIQSEIARSSYIWQTVCLKQDLAAFIQLILMKQLMVLLHKIPNSRNGIVSAKIFQHSRPVPVHWNTHTHVHTHTCVPSRCSKHSQVVILAVMWWLENMWYKKEIKYTWVDKNIIKCTLFFSSNVVWCSERLRYL